MKELIFLSCLRAQHMVSLLWFSNSNAQRFAEKYDWVLDALYCKLQLQLDYMPSDTPLGISIFMHS
jgi:hypothetical protein